MNLWVTNSYPIGFSFKDDTSAIPVGISPLDNGTKFRVVEFPPLVPTFRSLWKWVLQQSTNFGKWALVHLKPGDTVVQQATNHAWVQSRNRELPDLVCVDGLQAAVSGTGVLRLLVPSAITNWT